MAESWWDRDWESKRVLKTTTVGAVGTKLGQRKVKNKKTSGVEFFFIPLVTVPPLFFRMNPGGKVRHTRIFATCVVTSIEAFVHTVLLKEGLTLS